jgi:hypothetical protein
MVIKQNRCSSQNQTLIIALFPKMHASNLFVITSVAASLASGATFPLQKKADLFCPSPSIPFCCTRSIAGYDQGKYSYDVGCMYKKEKRERERERERTALKSKEEDA